MTNPPSEVKCCEKCREDEQHECRFVRGYSTPHCPCHHPQSEVKCCDCKHKGFRDPIYDPICECSCHKESPVSQSVEGWDRLNEQIMRLRTGATTYEKDEAVAGIRNVVRTLRTSTLSTLVEKMEGLKTNNHGEDESDYDRQYGFNEGISAAVEVVKKMV